MSFVVSSETIAHSLLLRFIGYAVLFFLHVEPSATKVALNRTTVIPPYPYVLRHPPQWMPESVNSAKSYFFKSVFQICFFLCMHTCDKVEFINYAQ